MELIDKNKVVKEIKKRINDLFTLDKASYEVGLFDAYKIILSFINTLEVKEVDLEKEIDRWYNKESSKEFKNVYYCDIEKFAKHFFKLGLKAKGEQL